MIRLYQGTGSGEITYVSRVEDSAWEKFKSLAGRMLRAEGKLAAAETLEKYPFVLNEGTNFFGDEFHYLSATFKVENYVRIAEEESIPEKSFVYKEIAQVISEVGPYYVRFIVMDLDRDGQSTSLVESPILQTTADKVREALADAEELLKSCPASSAVDRLHTAFHGYLQEQCLSHSISYNPSDSITALFKRLREGHPRLKGEIAKHEEIKRICNSLAAIIDSLNPIRNQLSRAHPNEEVVDEDEALLVVNIIRTLFHYLDSKL
jgi:hypothetical protein